MMTMERKTYESNPLAEPYSPREISGTEIPELETATELVSTDDSIVSEAADQDDSTESGDHFSEQVSDNGESSESE